VDVGCCLDDLERGEYVIYSVIIVSVIWFTQLIVNTRARMFQMTSAYYRNHDYQTDAIIFGGNIQRKSKNDKHVVTEMRVLKFGEWTYMYVLIIDNYDSK